ncbi:MAG: hypothetical protein ISS48_04995 [Candidatus Aenigmarchaeota archaeon]|nr:hypothetical protein [Candidatus Aenigmarchaeota archaeon]
MSKVISAIFWALVGIFVVIATYFAIPSPVSVKRGLFPFIAVLGIVFFLLGVALIVLTLKSKLKGKLKKFLLLTGISSAGFLVSVILHNFVYGLFIVLFDADFWSRIGVSDEPVFLIIAMFVCPIVFLIGVVGSIILFNKKRRK